MGTKLYVGNLSYDATQNDLQDLFAQAGAVTSVNLMQDLLVDLTADIAVTSLTGAASAMSFSFPPYSATVLSLNGTAPPPPSYQPDAMIKNSSDTAYVGAGVYNADGTSQTKSHTDLSAGCAARQSLQRAAVRWKSGRTAAVVWLLRWVI